MSQSSLTALVVPKAKVIRRQVNQDYLQSLLQRGVNPLKAQIMASRGVPDRFTTDQLLSPTLALIDSPKLLKDMDKGSLRLAQAIINKEHIALETDHDCDGQTSHAVLYEALVKHFHHPVTHVHSFIGHRLNEGYGLSESVMQRILEHTPKVSLVITADNGSSDEPRIAVLKEAGIDVIVTDHHEIPSTGVAQSAYAMINPTREDCEYPDPLIAGCMVAWLLVLATRAILIEKCHLPKEAPSIVSLLDFVAVGTIADCVSLARSLNNRIVVCKGLQLISQMNRACWRAIKPLCNGDILSEQLGFVIGPLLNSDGRLDSALGSVSFLLSDTDEVATQWVLHLQGQNQTRKQIQNKITQLGTQSASALYQKGHRSICVFLQEGHPGVHGISASRIKDLFGRPTFVFSPKHGYPDLITGSGRSIDGFHLRDALQQIHDENNQLLVSFGGHQGAAGVTLLKSDFQLFSAAFESIAMNKLKDSDVGPIIFSDGPISSDFLNLDFITKLERGLQPFGREFEQPIFEVEATVASLRLIGDETHAIVNLMIGPKSFKAMWFGLKKTPEDPNPVEVGQYSRFLISPKIEHYLGNVKLILHIEHCFDD